MPNWVFNRLAVSGEPTQVEAFTSRVCTSDSASNEAVLLDFEAIIPIPDALRDNPETDPNDPHGFPLWRTSAVELWGTKWNAWYPEVEGDPSSGTVTYSFQTAWTPPDKWLAAASAEFPALEFLHEYVEEMGQFAGRGHWQRGIVLEHEELNPDAIKWIGIEEDAP